MNNIFKKITYILTLSVALFTTGCGDDIDDEITSLDTSRLFSPTEVEALVINRTEVQVTWDAVSKAESYTIEVYDNANEDYSGTPMRQISGINFNELPYIITGFDGETTYSLRVQAISEDVPESKWTSTTFKTATEQIFSPVDIANDLAATWVTLRWIAGETATEIVFTPGDIIYTVTAADIAAGAATITGLTPETKYEAVLKNGTKTRGTASFETPLDLDGAIQVFPEDDLAALIVAAAGGEVFALMPGTYAIGKIAITKNISIKAAKPADKPIVNALISLEDGISFELKDVILDGTDAVETGKKADQAIQFNTADVSYGNINIEGCEIRNYLKGLLYFNVKGMAESITINNCVIHDIECNGGDLFDCRLGTAKQINFTNNTVYNSAAARDVFRIDNDNSSAFTSAPKLLVDHNTFIGVANDSKRRILYLRWVGNEITFANNIIANSPNGTFKHSSSNIIGSSNNNFYDADTMAGADTGSPTSLDPGFANPAGADFTVSNPTLISKGLGDPRWIP
ncbi:hypothetical protein M2451_002471 [Dysgonomonas sp. PFB1-18]|uniref:DUF4957 domain-containing protein n=1 Tax=unclassified Dysgonomonas TaxID=2630389 RepID=UPI002475BA66|nr:MULTISPECIES: DUF4957 domain-containing protein [unclassified Dysgonomonas]MDH6307952.1 hypothetical protein [Dysgonomonas sp. PF1-14]MDH6339491.1 hypothetical protein [Dysgonomonas sp. PF1-16]MDH6381142.1 hypothetical protein [Dysgonomonas sp. PFB1-18]MDH6398354.1 hypothetical protein [Dysgonomonas sp. PF1-23]